MGIIEVLLLAVGLSMDAFAVSICKGLATEKAGIGHMVTAGLWFGGFQMLMPVTGYLLGSTFASYITAIDHWIAFVLLGLIGLNMIRESRSDDCPEGSCPNDVCPESGRDESEEGGDESREIDRSESEEGGGESGEIDCLKPEAGRRGESKGGGEPAEDKPFGFKSMFIMAVATSIDALAVGITFAFLRVNMVTAIPLIGTTTFLISAAGIKIGSIFGSRFQSKAELAGGIILILLGAKILLEHTVLS